MKYLVVNADDFGACSGVNQGIIEAHRRGIVTSTSLMVERDGTEQAVVLAAGCPELGVGLHATVEAATSPLACQAVLEAQLHRFEELVGRSPSHLDSHHHVHAAPDLLPIFRRVSQGRGIPLRAYSPVHWCRRFYGQWGGQTHLEAVSVGSLLSILESDLIEGVTEVSCHPGLPDPALGSSYAIEREHELETLCDANVRRYLDRTGVTLIHFGHVARLASPASIPT
jgi:predicted glycoside hydrolase/deacetylase ChbG (UPF0249 family)